MLKRALDVFSPLQVFAGRMTLSALVLLPFAIRDLAKIPKDKWRALVLFAVLTNIFTTLFYAIAQSRIESSLNGMLNTLTPLMTLLAGAVLYRQAIQFWQGVGLALGLIGSIILVLFDSGWQIGMINAFAIFAILATLCNGLTANILKFSLKGLTVMQISSIAFLIVLPVSLTLGITADFIPTITQSEGGWTAFGYICILALFANVIGILLLSKLIQLSSPVFASLITYLMPLVALFWGALDHEVIRAGEIGAMALILSCVWLVNRHQEKVQDPVQSNQ